MDCAMSDSAREVLVSDDVGPKGMVGAIRCVLSDLAASAGRVSDMFSIRGGCRPNKVAEKSSSCIDGTAPLKTLLSKRLDGSAPIPRTPNGNVVGFFFRLCSHLVLLDGLRPSHFLLPFKHVSQGMFPQHLTFLCEQLMHAARIRPEPGSA